MPVLQWLYSLLPSGVISNKGTYVVSENYAFYAARLCKIEHHDRNVVVLTDGYGSGVHDFQPLTNHLLKTNFIDLLGSGVSLGIVIINPIDVILSHEYDVSLDF